MEILILYSQNTIWDTNGRDDLWHVYLKVVGMYGMNNCLKHGRTGSYWGSLQITPKTFFSDCILSSEKVKPADSI